VPWPEDDAFGTFADVSERFGGDVNDLRLMAGVGFGGEEKSGGGVPPEVPGLWVVLIPIGGIFVCGEDKSAGGFAGLEESFGDFEGVEERGAGGGEVESACGRDVKSVLDKVRGGAYGVKRRVRSGDDEVDILNAVSRERGQGMVDGFEAHGVDILMRSGFGACTYTGTLLNPLTGESVEFEKVCVIDAFLWDIKAACVDKHCCTLCVCPGAKVDKKRISPTFAASKGRVARQNGAVREKRKRKGRGCIFEVRKARSVGVERGCTCGDRGYGQGDISERLL
jgi:hypothetical protein